MKMTVYLLWVPRGPDLHGSGRQYLMLVRVDRGPVVTDLMETGVMHR